MNDHISTLVRAGERMDRMHNLMMEQVNHKASWYDAECLREMNEAPIEWARAYSAYKKWLST